MSCIIGYSDEVSKSVWMIGDSLSSNGVDTSLSVNHKVFRAKDSEVLVGVSGSWRVIDILSTTNIFRSFDKENFNRATIIVDLIPNIIALISDIEESVNILLALGDKLFEVQADYSVIEYADNFIAIGSGHRIAYGALYAQQYIQKLTIPEKLIISMKAASSYQSGYVGEPFILYNSIDPNYIIFRDGKSALVE